MKRLILLLLLGFASIGSLSAASMNDMNHGPFVSWTIRGEGESVTYKGIAIKVGDESEGAICFDTDLLRYSAGWTGGFLRWYPGRDGLERNPTIEGKLLFSNDAGPGWSLSDSFNDTRELPYGPLPKSQAHYKGLYRTGEEVVLAYTVGTHNVLESPGYKIIDDESYVTRQINFGVGDSAAYLRVTRINGADPEMRLKSEQPNQGVITLKSEAETRVVAFKGLPESAQWSIIEHHLCLRLAANQAPQSFALLIGGEPKTFPRTHVAKVGNYLAANLETTNLVKAISKTKTLWSESPTTPIREGSNRDAIAVDTLTVPARNPWNSWIRFGGIDFLNPDQALLGSVSGDVFLVSGLLGSEKKLHWKRFATGLYQPLGIKIVDDQIYVLGRDQITRLHDINDDGEADFYENFNNDCLVAENFHCFTLNLETDSQGNFYYAHGAPWPPVIRTPHQGILFKISPDGKTFESFADGLRGPNGMGISPNDMITYSDNEGHWLPTCSIQLIRPGGFHGMKPTAHLHESVPEKYEQPICWIPHDIDNSAGDHIWIDSEQWGPLNGKMLITSYGKSSVSLLLPQDVDGTLQGGTVKLPLRFRSGLIRGRQSPFDNHIYVCGLSFWQTTGIQPGGFYRLRYTGKPLKAPVDLAVQKNQISVTFSEPVDRELALDPESYNIEQWNYRWIEAYGSPHYSVENPEEKGHDTVAIRSIELSEDARTVRINVNNLVPVMQMKIAYNLETQDGDRLRSEIYNTIHTIPQ